jgi:hypothetical protein
MTAHAVGYGIELQFIVAGETVLVVLAFATNVRDGPASGFHTY